MEFDFKIDCGKFAPADFWRKNHKYFFLLFLALMSVFGAYVWQRSLNGGKWSEEKKQEYLSSQNKSVVLNEDNLKKALENVEARKKEVAPANPQVKDVFKGY